MKIIINRKKEIANSENNRLEEHFLTESYKEYLRKRNGLSAIGNFEDCA